MRDLIVCATDFSPEADAGLRWAAALAGRDGCRLDVVHVSRASQEDARQMLIEDEQIDAHHRETLGARLKEIAARVGDEEGLEDVRTEVLPGHPPERILAYARQEGARLVVLGTGGLSFVDRWVLGSVAERLVRAADRPVVLVPRPAEARPWRKGAARPPRVLAGVSLDADVGVLRFVAQLRQTAPCDVHVVHLYWPPTEFSRLGLQGRRDPIAPDPDVVANLEPAVRRHLGAPGHHGEGGTLAGQGALAIDIRPAWGDTTANLLVAAQEHEADLLVIGVEHRRGIGHLITRSIGERLARQSRYVPIACVPEPKEEHVHASSLPAVRSLLVATDFSELGDRAVPYAYALLGGRGGVVELCHVYERPVPQPAFAYDAPPWRLPDAERVALTEKLRALVPANAPANVTTHLSIVDGGKAAEALVQTSERLDVDAIVVASHGHSGLARAMLGSVASEVIHRAHRPVFVVRERKP